MICNNCKTELEEEEGMRFCSICGCPVEVPAKDAADMPEEKESEAHRKQITGIIIAIICLVVVASIILTIVFIKSRISRQQDSTAEYDYVEVVGPTDEIDDEEPEEVNTCDHSLDDQGYCKICGDDVGITIKKDQVDKYFTLELTENTAIERNPITDTVSGYIEWRIRPNGRYPDCTYEQCYIGAYGRMIESGNEYTDFTKLSGIYLKENGTGTISMNVSNLAYIGLDSSFSNFPYIRFESDGEGKIHYPSPAAQNTGSSKSANGVESDSAMIDKEEANATISENKVSHYTTYSPWGGYSSNVYSAVRQYGFDTSGVEKPYSAICVDGKVCVFCYCNYLGSDRLIAIVFPFRSMDFLYSYIVYAIDGERCDSAWISLDTGEIITEPSDEYWILDEYNNRITRISMNSNENGLFTYSLGNGVDQADSILISAEDVERVMKYNMGEGFWVDFANNANQTDILCGFDSSENGVLLKDVLTYYDDPNDAASNAYVINTSLPEDYFDNFSVNGETYEGSISEYILPDSSSRKITESDLSGLSAQELTYARNEIYARHGAVFKAAELNNYFGTKSWYSGQYTTDEVGSMLSDLERENAEFIRSYQDANGLAYKPQ